MTITKLLAATLLCGAGLATAAYADTWSGAYGNTITSTYTATGKVVKVYVNADHTYSIDVGGGVTVKGTWADNATQSCFTPTDPPPKPGDQPVCFPLREYKLGDTFTGTDATGAFTGVITPGR